MNNTYGNPAPLGLLGFGMTTILLNIVNAGIAELSIVVLAMGIFYGGLAQIVAGGIEFKKGNTFAGVAFTSYGFFWLTLVAIFTFPKFGFGDSIDMLSLVVFLCLWGIFTLFLYIQTVKNKAPLIGQLVFLTLTILFFLLALADATGSSTIKIIAGWEGILCGTLAMIDAFMQLSEKK